MGFIVFPCTHFTINHSLCLLLQGLFIYSVDIIYILDQYPSDVTQFTVGEHRVAVHDDRLAQALGSLDGDKRDILLLAYFLDLSDKEIADKLNIARSTIQYKRTSSLKEMRQRMEVKNYGTQTE